MGQSSGSSDDRDAAALSGGISGSGQLDYRGADPYRLDGVSAGTATGYTDGSGLTRDSYFGQTEESEAVSHQAEVEHPQQQSFLAERPAEAEVAPSAEVSTAEERWIAPAAGAATGVGLAGAGAFGYNQYEQDREAQPEMPAQSAIQESTPIVDNTGVIDYGAPVVAASAGPSMASNTYSTSEEPGWESNAPSAIENAAPTLGGNEAEGARVTGAFFPRVVRHGTDMSISQLHVPGEYPKRE